MHAQLLITLVLSGIKLALPQSIDPSTVDDSTKETWCTDQKASCPLLCLQIPGATAATEQNSCDATSLNWTCVCSNGQSPNISQYSQTVPYYECTQAATDCANNCAPHDNSCQSACRTDHPCGAQSPTLVNTSTISTMASTSSSSGSSATNTGFGVAAATGGSKSDAPVKAQVISFGRAYGVVMVLTVVGGSFMFML